MYVSSFDLETCFNLETWGFSARLLLRTLAVSTHEVVAAREPTHGGLLPQSGMRSSAIVVLQPAGQHARAIGRRVVGAEIGPFAQQGLDEAFGLAVGARRVRPRATMRQMEGATGRAKAPRQVGRAVVGEHAPDARPARPKPREGAAHKAAHRLRPLVGQQLDVRHARVVIDGDVHELPAGAAGLTPAIPR